MNTTLSKVLAREENLQQQRFTPGCRSPRVIKKQKAEGKHQGRGLGLTPPPLKKPGRFNIIAARKVWFNISRGVFPHTRNQAKHGIAWEATIKWFTRPILKTM